MSSQPGSGFENFGRKIDDAVNKTIPRVEEELKNVIAFLNNEVVPKVRENSSKGLRIAADQLTRLAEHLERAAAQPDPQKPGQNIR